MTGERIGPYELKHRLGAGGMGEVWEAWDERILRRVAVKRLRARGDLSSGELRRRILREARAAAAVVHPAIVQIFDIVEDGEDVVLVMERVPGETLEQLLERDGALDERRLIGLGIQLAECLGAAHDAGLLHLDLKASNVVVDEGDDVHLLDFGIAAAIGSSSRGAGTPGAMSPEQARGRVLDRRSDLFSLGALLYQAATGEPPFPGEDSAEIAREVCTRSPPPLAETVGLSEPLSDLVASLLEKDPEHRPQDATEVAEGLRAVDRSRPGMDERSGAEEEPTLEYPTVDELRQRTTTERTVTAGERPRAGRFLWAAAALLLAGLAVFFAARRGVFVAFLPEPLRIAVAPPVLSGDPALDLAPAAVQSALAEAIGGRRGLRTVPLSETARLDLPPAALGRAVAADEVLASRLDCTPRLCRVFVERLVDGQVLEATDLEAPTDSLRLLAAAVRPVVDRFYGTSNADAASGISDDDYRRYLEIWDAYWNRRRGREDLLGDLGAIVARSPDFTPAALLAAQLALHEFQDSRAPAERSVAASMIRLAAASGADELSVLVLDAELALVADEVERAEEIARQLDRQAPGNTASLRLRAKVLERGGRVDAALDELRRLVERQPTVSHRLLLARYAYRHGRNDEARRELQEVLDLAPGLGQATSLLAEIELLAGDLEQAATLYRSLASSFPRASYWSGAGLAEMLRGDAEAAIECHQRAVELAPQNPLILLNLADALELGERPDEARDRYRQVVELTQDLGDAERAPLHSVRAQALAHLGRKREAVQSVETARRLAPDHPGVALEAAVVYSLVGDRYSALAAAETAVQGGMGARWFTLPWLRWLGDEPEVQKLVADAGRSRDV